jgi:hypothetical protein
MADVGPIKVPDSVTTAFQVDMAASLGAGISMGFAEALRGGDRTVHQADEPGLHDLEEMPEPPAERSAGPIKPGRGSMLQDKVAVVTGDRAASAARSP